MPLYMEADGKGIMPLCLMEVIDEPCRSTLQAAPRSNVAQGSYHGYSSIHPMAGRHDLDGVVLLLAGS